MTDIIDRLSARCPEDGGSTNSRLGGRTLREDLQEAAAEIARLRSLNAGLVEAARRYIAACDAVSADVVGRKAVYEEHDIARDVLDAALSRASK